MILFPDVCKNCRSPKRTLHCHAHCRDYLGAKDEHAVKVDEERRAKKAQDDADSVVYLMTKG